MKKDLLVIGGLKKSFGEQVILNGVDLSLSEKSITTILGKSGMGKSVFLKCLAGLLQPDGGEIKLLGEEVYPKPSQKNWRKQMGYLFQGNALFEHLTVEQNILLPMTEESGKGIQAFREQGEELLAALDLTEAAHKRPGELSGGMRRRVALARCLIQKPELILFDEPTTGLDPVRSAAVFEMIRRYRDELGFSALIVSHDLPNSLEVADAPYVLRDGLLHKVSESEKEHLWKLL